MLCQGGTRHRLWGSPRLVSAPHRRKKRQAGGIGGDVRSGDGSRRRGGSDVGLDAGRVRSTGFQRPMWVIRAVLEVAEELDLSAFEGGYRADGQGGAGCPPVILIALLFYGYGKGMRSSPGIERACRDDLSCRIIAANRGGPLHRRTGSSSATATR
ncbi:transposase [Streptomyces sp. CB01881]|uniref:transposase n=1 Tax=Streptomyces sp. CB01881 TaxID=2078691 RepID=UPI0011E00C57|nr:transposase [Streptomyces sp. CB01881]TYC66333.1 transposase [Streptomyces sp. CB01881]